MLTPLVAYTIYAPIDLVFIFTKSSFFSGARSALMLWLVAQTVVVSLATIVPQATEAGEGGKSSSFLLPLIAHKAPAGGG